MPRQFGHEDYCQLKTAIRRLIAECGGVESAARVSRVNKTVLSDYQNPEKPDCMMPVDVAADLERDCGNSHVSSALARLAGGYFVKPKSGRDIASIAAALPRIGKETGDVFARAAKALADGKINDRERNQIHNDIEEAIAAFIVMQAQLEDLK